MNYFKQYKGGNTQYMHRTFFVCTETHALKIICQTLYAKNADIKRFQSRRKNVIVFEQTQKRLKVNENVLFQRSVAVHCALCYWRRFNTWQSWH